MPGAATPTRQTPDRLGALARCVGDAGFFLDRKFAVAPHRANTSGFDDLLSLADVDAQIAGGGLRPPSIRLVRNGHVLPAASWTRRVRTGGTWVDDLMVPGRALDAFAGGATVVLQSLQRWWPPLARFCRDLELALDHPVQANAYLTPAGAQGLAPHHDTHDVFILQVLGTKRWTVREPVVEAPLPRHRSDHEAAARQPVLFDVALQPGDCMYLPRGFVHSATAQAATSLHITVGVLALTVHDVLREVVSRAADDPRFRRAVPVGFASDAELATSVVKDAVAELSGWLGSFQPAPLADELRRRFWARRVPPLSGHLLELAGLGAVDDDTVVHRRHGATCLLRVDGGHLVVGLGDRTLHLPATLEGAVRRLVDGADHRVRDLDDLLDGPSRLVLVRRLVREGLLQTDASIRP